MKPPQERRVLTLCRSELVDLVDEMLQRAGITRTEAADRMGISKAAVSHQVNGQLTKAGKYEYSRVMSAMWLVRLAAVCRCEIWIRFPGDPERVTK